MLQTKTYWLRRISNTDLSRKVGLSESPCLRRVRKLEGDGVIAGYSALLDHRKLGLDMVAYVQVNLDQRSEADTNAFVKAVKKARWIVECVAISGTHDYLLKIVAKNIDHFGELTMKKLLRFPDVPSQIKRTNRRCPDCLVCNYPVRASICTSLSNSFYHSKNARTVRVA